MTGQPNFFYFTRRWLKVPVYKIPPSATDKYYQDRQIEFLSWCDFTITNDLIQEISKHKNYLFR